MRRSRSYPPEIRLGLSRRPLALFASSAFWPKTSGVRPSLPIMLPPDGEWLVRLIALQDRFVFGEYRRHMKTIGYLGQIDKLCGAKATTRNWNTIMAVMRILKSREAASEL